MKSKLIISKQLENLAINVTLLENMLSKPTSREEFLVEINKLKEKIKSIQVLIDRESEEFV